MHFICQILNSKETKCLAVARSENRTKAYSVGGTAGKEAVATTMLALVRFLDLVPTANLPQSL